MSDTGRRARRVGMIIGAVAFFGLLIVYGGSALQPRVTSCTRATTADNSTWQTGEASIRWLPPMVHCHYPSTSKDEFSALKLPETSEDHFAALGTVLMVPVAILVALLGGAALVRMGANDLA